MLNRFTEPHCWTCRCVFLSVVSLFCPEQKRSYMSGRSAWRRSKKSWRKWRGACLCTLAQQEEVRHPPQPHNKQVGVKDSHRKQQWPLLSTISFCQNCPVVGVETASRSCKLPPLQFGPLLVNNSHAPWIFLISSFKQLCKNCIWPDFFFSIFSQQAIRYCNHCQIVKPDRCHHCSTCEM